MTMWDKIKDRLSEPSTWGGLAAATVGVGQVTKINEAPQVAEVIAQIGQVAITGDYVTAGAVGLMGLFSVFMKEKGSK